MRVLGGCILAGAAALASGTALAADVETVPVHDWTGFYVGAYGGAAWADADVEDDFHNTGNPDDGVATEDLLAAFNVLQHGSLNETLGVYGIQAGYNVQLQSIVLGIQGDFGSLDIDLDDHQSGFWNGVDPVTKDVAVKTDWLATIRGRLGFVPSENLLIYATGGLAITEVDLDQQSSVSTVGGPILITLTLDVSETKTLLGWTVGTGMEWAINDRWSFGAEYLHIDFGSISGSDHLPGPVEGTSGPVIDTDADLSVDTVRAFLNFRL